jgi:hypothetical protein
MFHDVALTKILLNCDMIVACINLVSCLNEKWIKYRTVGNMHFAYLQRNL